MDTLCSDRGTLMSIGSAFSFIQLNTSQASIFSQYMQRLCGVAFKGSVSTDHAVTHVLGNSSPFRLYCSAFHPRRNLWRDQSLRAGEGRERLQKLHSWMAESNRELEGNTRMSRASVFAATISAKRMTPSRVASSRLTGVCDGSPQERSVCICRTCWEISSFALPMTMKA